MQRSTGALLTCALVLVITFHAGAAGGRTPSSHDRLTARWEEPVIKSGGPRAAPEEPVIKSYYLMPY